MISVPLTLLIVLPVLLQKRCKLPVFDYYCWPCTFWEGRNNYTEAKSLHSQSWLQLILIWSRKLLKVNLTEIKCRKKPRIHKHCWNEVNHLKLMPFFQTPYSNMPYWWLHYIMKSPFLPLNFNFLFLFYYDIECAKIIHQTSWLAKIAIV